MTYPDILPALKLKSTISHPIHPEKVMGFVGRNTKLGRRAIVMKEDALTDGRVMVPTGASEGLLEGVGELVLLNDTVVKTMDGEDFAAEYHLHSLEGGGQHSTMNCVERESKSFQSWDRSAVEIEN